VFFRVTADDDTDQKQVTMGACLELLPIVERLIHKEYEKLSEVNSLSNSSFNARTHFQH